MKVMKEFSMLVVGMAAFAFSAHAESTKSILSGRLVVKAESRPVRAVMYTDGRADYLSLSYDLLAKDYVGAVRISHDNCSEYLNFAGLTKEGEAISLRTILPRTPPKGVACPAWFSPNNTNGVEITPHAKEILSPVYGNLKR